MIFLDLLTLVTINLKGVGISLRVLDSAGHDVSLRNVHKDLISSYVTINKMCGHVKRCGSTRHLNGLRSATKAIFGHSFESAWLSCFNGITSSSSRSHHGHNTTPILSLDDIRSSPSHLGFRHLRDSVGTMSDGLLIILGT